MKRMGRRLGDTMIGDVHLGDWGLQIGLIITELHERQPDLVYFEALHKLLLDSIRAHSEEVAFARNADDLRKNAQAGKLSAFLTLEDGRAVQGSMTQLQEFYEQGVRLITLTWNDANCFGAPNTRDPVRMQKGLTTFGKEAVRFMQ